WCEKNEEWIRKTAYQLYKLLRTQYAGKALKKRCCDFKKLEEAALNISRKGQFEG
ncbi:MAG: type III toxin-antitoxin system ToxN/AbiQ family toxin, partial [Clostridiales Family XIII bacterium]|nr:type III toxin-antitoxin system ToxN/AbiQ family toxin [Clostridiales Family XIII bacterium]